MDYFKDKFQYSEEDYEESFLKKSKFSIDDFEFISFTHGFCIQKKETLFRILVKEKYPDTLVHAFPKIADTNTFSLGLKEWLEKVEGILLTPNHRDEEIETAVSFLHIIYHLQETSGASWVKTVDAIKPLEIKDLNRFEYPKLFRSIDYVDMKFNAWTGKYDRLKLNSDAVNRIKSFCPPEEKPIDPNQSSLISEYEYQVALSYSRSEQYYVDKVAEYLKAKGVAIYYDRYELASMWGKDLYQHLSSVYSKECDYCVVFLSKSYANKLWTKLELRSAQERAFKENKEYLLPVRFDDTEIPGIASTISYIDANVLKPSQIGDLVISKLLED